MKYLENTAVIDPKYMEDMAYTKNFEDVDSSKAQLLLKEIPQDAACLA